MKLSEEIRLAVSDHGHGCVCRACMARYCRAGRGLDKILLWRLIAAGALFVAAIAASRILPWASVALGAASVLIAGYDVLLRAAVGVAHGRFDERLLMSLAILAALALGEACEGAAGMLLLRAGELTRCLAVERARERVGAMTGGNAPLELPSGPEDGVSRAEETLTHFARVYTPVVLGISVVIAALMPLAWHTTAAEGVRRALVFMAVACPCAAVLAVPLAYAVGMGGAARHGVLYKNAAAVDAAARPGVILFEKRAALEGEGLRVTSVKCGAMDAEVFLRIAAHAGAYADDPISRAIRAAYQGTIYIELVRQFREEPDGVAVKVDGVDILLGSEAFVRSHGVDPGVDTSGEKCVYLAIDERYAGRITFGSVAREGAAQAVALLWERGRRLALMTEDSPAAAEIFARTAGLQKNYAGRGPAERAAQVRQLCGREDRHGIMFVGSAETDGESLRAADVGVALCGVSSPAALDTGDVILEGGDPMKLVAAVEGAGHIAAVARQCVLFPVAVKLVILLMYMLNVCPLWLAVFADTGTALLTCLNALRAQSIREAIPPAGTEHVPEAE